MTLVDGVTGTRLDDATYGARKAVITTAGLCGWVVVRLFFVRDWPTAAFPLFSYAILLLHTYCSVRAFSQVIPRTSASQNAIDLVLAVPYLVLPMEFENPLRFASVGIVFFALAAIKYGLLLRTLHDYSFVKRKITSNIVAATVCVCATYLSASGHLMGAVELQTTMFALASVYFFLVDPLYVLARTA
jgi:hypothetical protein